MMRKRLAMLGLLCCVACVRPPPPPPPVAYFFIRNAADSFGTFVELDHVGAFLSLPWDLSVNDTPSMLTGVGIRTFLLEPDAVTVVDAEFGTVETLKVGEDVLTDRLRARGPTYWVRKLAEYIDADVVVEPDGSFLLYGEGLFDRTFLSDRPNEVSVELVPARNAFNWCQVPLTSSEGFQPPVEDFEGPILFRLHNPSRLRSDEPRSLAIRLFADLAPESLDEDVQLDLFADGTYLHRGKRWALAGNDYRQAFRDEGTYSLEGTLLTLTPAPRDAGSPADLQFFVENDGLHWTQAPFQRVFHRMPRW